MQEYFSQKTVLVTGAAGFVGSHLCDRLLALGADVIGVDNFISGRAQNLAHLLPDGATTSPNATFRFIQADVAHSPTTYLPQDVVPDLILHFASPASPPHYQQYPIETYLVNSLGTHELLQFLLARNPAGRFLYASTSEVYGDPQVHPQPESYWGNVNPNGVRSCYDEGKRLGETICGVHQRDYNLDVRMVRIFNTYGPRLNPTDGRVISNFLQQALRNMPLTIYGDGSQSRSYCYISDLVEGVLLLASTEGLSGATVNLGNPDERTVLETAQYIQELTGNSQELTYHPMPKDDPTRRQPDITQATQLLGWKPQVEFRAGLERTIAYYREHELISE